MKAIVVYGPKDIRYDEVELPKLGPWDVLARVKYCGICGTDLEIYNGDTTLAKSGLIKYPVRIGHEWSGVVVEIGANVDGLKIGDRVISDTGSSCGECEECHTGNFKKCRHIASLGTLGDFKDGAFAEYIVMHSWHIHKVPDNIGLDEATLIEPATIALNALIDSHVGQGKTIVVTGTGSIGLSAVSMAKSMGARVILAGRKDFKLEIGSHMGADAVVNVTRTQLREFINDFTNGEGIDLLYETTGAAGFINEVHCLIKYAGAIGLVGFYESLLDGFDISRLVMMHQSLLGLEGSGWRAEQVIKMLENGEITLKPMITNRVPFEKAIESIKTARHNTAEKIKTLVEISDKQV